MSDRYRILDRIGAGGLGVVYRVEDRASGEVLAMKVMPRARGTANLRSEFLAMARLSHDNIVSVIDYGLTESGHDYFTMRYVDGPSLLESVDQVPSEQFYLVIGGVLRALAFVHARGMVHADIKPSNILVDASTLAEHPEKAARLADFGLSAAIDDPSSSAARGTFPYAAPEVYAGRLDARSDLYSVGVVLYEMATGTKPYTGRNVREILAAQRRGGPPDPRTIRDDLPAELCELICSLCDPAPGARPQTADEVLARLNEFAGTEFAIADSRPLVDLSGVLVGRERDLSELQRMWKDARDGRGAAMLLSGDEGIGKSRLMAELKLFVQLDGGNVYSAEVAARDDRPYAGISDLVRAVLASLGGGAWDSAREWRRTLAPLLGGKNTQTTDRASRFALSEAVTGVLLHLASTQPMLVILDDVHLADPATVEMLAYLARSVPDSSVLMVMAARTAADDGNTVVPIASAIRNAARGQRLDLPPIDKTSVFRLTEQAFGTDIARALGVDLYRSTGGNPSHAVGALEHMVAAGAVARERGRWILRDESPEIVLPDDAMARALKRLSELTPEARRCLAIASVLGESFSGAIVAELVGNDAAVDASLAMGVSGRLLLADAGGGTFRFTPRSLVDHLYCGLDEATRRTSHERAVSIFENRRIAGALESPGTLAHHHLAVGNDERAVELGLEAAEAHANAYDHHGALEWFRRVRPLITDADRGAEVDERLGDLYALVGEADDAHDAYRAAYGARASSPNDHIRLARRIGELQRKRGEGNAALDLLMAALDEARRARLLKEEAQCHLRIGWVLMYRADYKAATEHTIAGQLIAKSGDDRAIAAELGRLRAAIDIYQGDTKSALTHLAEALEDAELTGDELLVAGVLHEIGRAAIHAGDYPRAIDALEKAIPATESVGHIEQTAKSLNNLGAACYFQGDWERARTSWERFRRLCERLDEHSELVNALNNLGSLYRELGQFSDALAVLERGAEVADLTGHAHMAAMVLGNRGETLFRKGDLAAARECYTAALRQFERIGAREDIIETRRRMCEADTAAGRINEALDRAIDTAREAKDAGAVLEEGILHRVAAHALRIQGDLESATWFIERADEIATKLGARYEHARVELERAELSIARGEADEARELLESAISRFAALGARWDLGRARARQQSLLPGNGGNGRGAAPTHVRKSLDLLLEMTQAAANVEIERLLEIAMDKVLALTNFERGFILLLDPEGRPQERLRRLRSGAKGFARDEAEFSGTIVRRVAASGQATRVSDMAEEDELREQKSVVALGLRQIMCVPMRAHGRVVGIIYIDSRRLEFEEPPIELPILEAVAAQVALAIENARLHTSEKRKGELMAILAHEIRNPLAGILGYSDLGEEDGELHIEPKELFGRIRRDAERLRRLVDNVLELARHESGNVEWSMGPFNMAELVGEIVASYEPTCEQKNISISTNTSKLNGPALGNPDRIMQVLANLVNNAVKFSGPDDTIVITARREAVAPDDPELPPLPASHVDAWAPTDPTAEVAQDFVRVDVADSGPGMSKEMRDRLFQKFAQGESGKRASGVGIGLYISREIIRRHGGTIWVESEPGKGATFSFRIPVA